MSNNSKRIENLVTEDGISGASSTGVSTVSSPDVGHNVQMPMGSTPPSGNEYRKRNKNQPKKTLSLLKRETHNVRTDNS